jgi:hypothetical protein
MSNATPPGVSIGSIDANVKECECPPKRLQAWVGIRSLYANYGHMHGNWTSVQALYRDWLLLSGMPYVTSRSLPAYFLRYATTSFAASRPEQIAQPA